MSRNGPKLRIVASCQGCVYEHTESYCVEDGNDVDSGVKVYCGNDRAVSAAGGAPSEIAKNGLRRVGDTTWDTPAWCPLLAAAKAALLAAEAS